MVAAVALVYKTGGDYSLEYVDRLTRSCLQFGASHVVCLSDDTAVADICEHIPLVNDWPGWWSKLELFLHLKSALYFDLDTIVNRSIKPILKYNHTFTMLKGFTKNNHRGASGVMAWNGDYSYIAKTFRKELIPIYSIPNVSWGDQDWINDRLQLAPEYFQDLFPKQIVSRKKTNKYHRRFASVICYHGKPRPHSTGWAI